MFWVLIGKERVDKLWRQNRRARSTNNNLHRLLDDEFSKTVAPGNNHLFCKEMPVPLRIRKEAVYDSIIELHDEL